MTTYTKMLNDYRKILEDIDNFLDSQQMDEEEWFAARCGLLDGAVQSILEKLAEMENVKTTH